MRFRLFGTGIAAIAMLATSYSARAADIPRPVYKGVPHAIVAYYNWMGFYIDINAGYAWGTSRWDSPAMSLPPKGGMVGGTLGYNYQEGSIVWGIEGDFDAADVKQSQPCFGAFSCQVEQRWFATVRGRLGYAFARFLPYVTAGGAFSNIRASTNNPAFPGANNNRFGWTVGAGLEYAFLGNWTTKVEYLYADLGRFIATSPAGRWSGVSTTSTSTNTSCGSA